MATAKAWIRNNRWWLLSVLALIVTGVAVMAIWFIWPRETGRTADARPSTPSVSRKDTRNSDKTKSDAALPEKSLPNRSAPEDGAAVSTPVAGESAPSQAPSASTPVSPVPKSANALPIAVDADGRTAPLDVQSIMVLQRDHAQRRLYDRVASLSASVIRTMPALGMASPSAGRNETALGTLLGGAAVAAGAAPIPGGAPQGTTGNLAGVAAAVIAPNVGRLVSVYSRGDVQVAEVRFASGRRIDLEVSDVFQGRNVIAITESGITLETGDQRKKIQFVALGQSLVNPE